jgi:hypothetical protein
MIGISSLDSAGHAVHWSLDGNVLAGKQHLFRKLRYILIYACPVSIFFIGLVLTNTISNLKTFSNLRSDNVISSDVCFCAVGLESGDIAFFDVDFLPFAAKRCTAIPKIGQRRYLPHLQYNMSSPLSWSSFSLNCSYNG